MLKEEDTEILEVIEEETELLAVTDGVRDGVGLVVVLTDGVGTRLVYVSGCTRHRLDGGDAATEPPTNPDVASLDAPNSDDSDTEKTRVSGTDGRPETTCTRSKS